MKKNKKELKKKSNLIILYLLDKNTKIKFKIKSLLNQI